MRRGAYDSPRFSQHVLCIIYSNAVVRSKHDGAYWNTRNWFVLEQEATLNCTAFSIDCPYSTLNFYPHYTNYITLELICVSYRHVLLQNTAGERTEYPSNIQSLEM